MSKQTKIQPASKAKANVEKAWSIQNEMPMNENRSLLPFKYFRHSKNVISIAYSPNGNQLAAGGEDNKVTIYDLENKGAILHTFEHSSWVRSIAYSPNGNQLAAGGTDKKVTIYDLENKGAILHTFEHSDNVNSIAYSPNGNQLAAGGREMKITIYDLENKGAILHTFEHYHSGWVINIAYSPNGNQLAAGGLGNIVTVYDLENKGAIVHTFEHYHFVWNIAYSPNGNQLAACGEDKKVTIYDLENKGAILHTFEHSDDVLSIAYSPNGNQLAGGGRDKKVNIYDLENTGAILHTFEHSDDVYSIAYSPNGNQLAAGGNDKKVTINDLENKGAILHMFEHSNRVCSIAYSPNGNQLAAGDMDKKVIIHDLENKGAILHTFELSRSVNCIAYSPNGNQLAAGVSEMKVTIYDLENKGAILHTFEHSDDVCGIAYSPNGNQLAAAGGDKKVTVYDLENKGAILHTFEHCNKVLSIAYSPNGNQLAAGGDDKKVTIYDLENKGAILHTFEHYKEVWSIAYSPNGNQLAAGDLDKKVTIYDLENKGAILHTFEHSIYVTTIAYSPNGNQLAAGGWDKKVTVYDLENKGAILHTFEHSNYVYSIAYSPNGNQLAAGGDDKKVTMYSPTHMLPNEINIKNAANLCNSSSFKYLMYRQQLHLSKRKTGRIDPTTSATQTMLAPTLMHRLVEEGSVNMLEEFKQQIIMLNAPVPLKSSKNTSIIVNETPLDTAIRLGSHDKCFKLMELIFINATPSTIERLTAVTPSIPKLLEVECFDAVEQYFQNAIFKTTTNKHTRFQVDRPLFQKSNISCPHKSNYLFEQEGGKHRLEVQTYLVGTRNLLQKEIILPILEKASLKTFETKAMQFIVAYFWERLWKKYLLHAIIYLCLIATFSFGHWLALFKEDAGEVQDFYSTWGNYSMPCLLVSAAIALYLTMLEVRHITRRGMKKHFKSGWNRCEMVCYMSVFVSVAFAVLQVPSEEIIHAPCIIIVWIGLLIRIRGFKMFSVLITTFVQILHDLREFIIVLLIIMVGFGLGLKILLKTPDEINNFQIVETIYYMMFGLVDLDFLKPAEKPNTATMAFTLVGAFMFIVVIVLLNMLIALMGDSYDNVTENIQIESIRARARVCADLLVDINSKDKIFCEWLHVCAAKDENAFSNRSTWEGNLKAMKREMGGVKKELKEDIDGMKKDIDGVKKNIDGMKKNVDGMKNDMGYMNKKLDAIMELLIKKT